MLTFSRYPLLHINNAVNNEPLHSKGGFFDQILISPKNKILVLNKKFFFSLYIDLKNVLSLHNSIVICGWFFDLMLYTNGKT